MSNRFGISSFKHSSRSSASMGLISPHFAPEVAPSLRKQIGKRKVAMERDKKLHTAISNKLFSIFYLQGKIAGLVFHNEEHSQNGPRQRAEDP